MESSEILWIGLTLLLVAQEPSEQYPGQREHRKPPDGWSCLHQNIALTVPPNRVCACERACDPETGITTEDRSCSAWCHRPSCECGKDLPPCGGEKRPF